MLKIFMDFNDNELNQIYEFLREQNIHMIPVTEIEYKNFWIYINNILGPVFIENAVNVHK